MRPHNLYISDRPAELQRLKEEYESLGFDTKIRRGELVVFALKRREKKKDDKAKNKKK